MSVVVVVNGIHNALMDSKNKYSGDGEEDKHSPFIKPSQIAKNQISVSHF
jgi:hypothetical protein